MESTRRATAPAVLSATGRRLAAAGLLVIAGLAGAVAAPPAAWAGPGESIASYDSRSEVAADGKVRITETIRYDFGDSARHGIIREFPIRYHYDNTHDRITPISDVSVTMDSRSVPVQDESGGSTESLRIGDPNRTLTGVHTYVIAFTARGLVNAFPDHDEFYWNAVGTQWQVPIAQATATVSGPAGVTQVECFAGPDGSRLSCPTKSYQDNTASFAGSDLGNGSGLSVVVAFPAGSVSGTAPILVQRHDLTAAFRATPVTLGVGGALALLGVAGAALIAWLVGRDRRYVGLLPGLAPGYGQTAVEERKPLVGAPPVSVEFTPPDDIRPGQVGTLIDERADVVDVTATILDFAVKRHLHIAELPRAGKWDTQDWELRKLTDGDPKFLPYERRLFDALFRGRDSVRLSELKYTFATDLALTRSQLYADMVKEGWYRQSPRTTRAAARAAAVLALLVSVAITALLAVFTQVALIGVGLVLGAVALLAMAGRFPARTGRGSAMLARVQGLRLYIATTEAEQIKFQERAEIFSRYLPYAMVFGLVDRWAGVFKDIGTQVEGGAPGLYWYSGLPGWSMLYFASSIGNFATTTTGTIATTSPPAASGHSGFGGGGFSGGGFGGGGGGSW